MVRRRRLSAYLGFPVADACWREEDVTIFSSVEKRRWGGATLISKPLGERRLSGLSKKDRFGGVPVHDEHVPQPMHAPQRLRVELEQRISTHEETLWKAVRNAARRINASTL